MTGWAVGGLELGRVRPGEPGDVACEVDRHCLQTQADTETRHRVLPGVAGSSDLAFDAAVAEAARDDDAVEVTQLPVGEQPFDALRLDPLDLDLRAVVEAGMLQALHDRQVGVGQFDVLADQADA